MNDKNLTSHLLLETADIRWHELQRFFASGYTIAVHHSLDLLYVAEQITLDNATQVQEWMNNGLVDAVNDSQAQDWYEKDEVVWALVIKPWVLVQEKTRAKNHVQ